MAFADAVRARYEAVVSPWITGTRMGRSAAVSALFLRAGAAGTVRDVMGQDASIPALWTRRVEARRHGRGEGVAAPDGELLTGEAELL